MNLYIYIYFNLFFQLYLIYVIKFYNFFSLKNLMYKFIK